MKKQKRTHRDFQEFLLENLKDPTEAAAYLEAARAEEDEGIFLLALRNVEMAINPIKK